MARRAVRESVTIAGRAERARVARAFTAGVLGPGYPRGDDAALLVSELFGNSIWYLLPLPTRTSPVVLPHLASSLHAHLNGRYANPVWPLAPLTENPSTSKEAIRWRQWPAAFQDEMRSVPGRAS